MWLTRLMLGTCGLTALVLTGFAQGASQEYSLGGLSIRRDSVMAPNQQRYNVMLDDLALAVRYYGSMIYDDNGNRASGVDGQDPVDYTLMTHGLEIGMDWPLTANVRLSGDISVEWLWTLAGEYNDGIYFGGANFAGDNTAGLFLDLVATDQHLVTISQLFGRYHDLSDHGFGFNRDTQDLSYWYSESAGQWEYHISPLVEYGLRIQRETYWAEEDVFEYLERDEDTISTKVKFQVNPNLSIEPYISYTQVHHDEENWEEEAGSHKRGNNDYDLTELGIAGLWHLNPVMDFRYAFGWQWVDVNNNARAEADEQDDAPFFRTRLEWEVTSTFRNFGEFSHEMEGSVIPHVNYREITTLGYGMEWQFQEDWMLFGDIRYIRNNESDRGETGDLFEEQIGVTYVISPKATLTGWYMRRDHDSDRALREYSQNRVGLEWTYKF